MVEFKTRESDLVINVDMQLDPLYLVGTAILSLIRLWADASQNYSLLEDSD